MQRAKLFGILTAGLCFVTGTIASAEPATKPAPKKHAACQSTKVKTSCEQQATMKDYITSRQATPNSDDKPGAETSAAIHKQAVKSAEDAADPQQPK